jgi:cell division protein ZapD
VDHKLTYEQPLNERVRTMLRLDFLFRLADHHLQGSTEWDTRSALNSLLDINDLVSRTDIKNELIKELERDAAILRNWQKNPEVDPDRLDIVLTDIHKYLENLRDTSCQPGLALKQNELVSAVKQRNAMLGGSCNFDLPAYHQWLHRPDVIQQAALEHWQDDLRIIKKSTFLALNLIRNSSTATVEIATQGMFQKSLEQNANYQLIRIILPADSPYFPEISAGKHRFSVRFMEQPDTMCRPNQTDADVKFKLQCCTL